MHTSASLCLMGIAFALLAAGQTAGSLVGTVRDPSGAPVAAASVTARQTETGIVFKKQTDNAGVYVFDALPLGAFQLTFTAPGFRDLQIDGLQTHVASTYRQDATLQLAANTTQLQVEESTPLVPTETAETSQLVDSRQIEELPLNGRDVYSLLTLAAGAQTGVSPTSRFTNLQRPALAGGRAGYTVFQIDGIDVNSQNLPSASVTPGVDAVQEFRAVTQLAPASQPSTSTVSVAIRSGGNDLHGSAYDFFRNNVLDAHPFFERTIDTPDFHTQPDQLRYNEFGGSLGGPIRRDRTFFFADVQVMRQEALSQTTSIFPTAQMLAGNFSGVNPLSGAAGQAFRAVIDPQAGRPFAGNQIPASRFSNFASKFLPIAFVPANCPACLADGLGFNFAGEAPAYSNSTQFVGRVDHYFSERDALSGSFEIQPGDATTAASPIPGAATHTPVHSYFASVNEIHNFSPSLVNQFRAGYTRLSAVVEPEQSANGAFAFQNTPTSLPSLLPVVDFAGYPSLFGSASLPVRNYALDDSWNLADSLDWTHGRHQVEAGFDAIRAHFWNTLNFGAFFVYADNLPAVLGFSGNSFGDFLLGVPFEGLTFQGTGKAPMVDRTVPAGYVQDTWKASNRVTISYGLRYEYAQRWHDANTALNRLGTLDTSAASQALGGRFLLGGSPNTYVPGIGLVQGTGGPLIRGSIVDPDWRDFQPRIGIAYRPFPDNKTVIRAGAGIYYALQDANSLAFEMLSPPFSYANTFLNLPPQVPLGQPLRDSQFWPAGSPTGVAQEGDSPRNRDPRLYQWTASIERQISNQILLAAEYVGNHGIDQPLSLLVNQPALPDAAQLTRLEANPALNTTLAQARAPFSRVALPYQYLTNIGQSWYDALNLRAEGRFGRRLNFSAVYTWSKALDMASAEQQLPEITSNLAASKSYSDYDHPQRFVASLVYDLPFGETGPRALWKKLAGGWELTGISTFESGAPYSVTMGVDTSFTGGAAAVFPDMIGKPVFANIRQSNGIYLTPQNFAAPPFGQFGTLTRNQFHGPGIDNVDFGLMKNIPVTERLSAQLRFELFNAFNHAQFQFAGSALAQSIAPPAAGSALPSIQYTDPSEFGRVTALAPRILQIALRLNW